uniref:Uncharacterized protein n=1 Tax=Rhizophora mucronata TaxID=61149 RepID=A0A2P2P6A0_RHIMU
MMVHIGGEKEIIMNRIFLGKILASMQNLNIVVNNCIYEHDLPFLVIVKQLSKSLQPIYRLSYCCKHRVTT